MQTRKLVAGETLLLEEENGFCIVVDGTVQIFTRSRREEPHSDSFSDDDGEPSHAEGQGYQLLTEVKNGAPMSSLFSILSLFTEDVRLKHPRETTSFARGDGLIHPPSANLSPQPQTPAGMGITTESDKVPHPHFAPGAFTSHGHRRISSGPISNGEGLLPSVPPMALDPSEDARSPRPSPKRPKLVSKQSSAHPDIVARASTDAQIAIIPASAFRRLTKSYPKATAHIIQVILNRFYRVTLVTGHQYLGLTQEILKTDKKMNKFTTCELPDFLRDSALEGLKQKFAEERERIGAEEALKGIALHNPRTTRPRRASSLRKDATAHARLAVARNINFGSLERIKSPGEEDQFAVNAGDLLANGSIGNKASYSQPLQGLTPGPRLARSPLAHGYFNPLTIQQEYKEVVPEGEIFREAILECMCTAMGLTNENLAPQQVSVEASPRLVSYDSRRQKAVFNSAFGLMDSYDMSQDGETESVMSAAPSGMSQGANQHLLEDMVDELEIVFFEKDSVLVEQQERLPGLYYVVDGFLEVSLSLEEDSSGTNIFGTEPAPGLTAADLNRSSYQTDTNTPKTKSSGRGKNSEKRNTHRQSLFLLKPGSLAGYLPAVSGFRSFVDVTAKSNVIVGFLPRASLERLVEKYPIILLTLAKRLTAILDRMILHIDFALEYLQLNTGQVVYEQGDQSDAIFIVLNGRLRAIEEREGKGVRILGEYGQGDSVGELEVLTETKRPGSLHAQRDTEVAKLPKMLFNSLAQEHPAITMRMSKILARRMRALVEGPLTASNEHTAIGGSFNPSSIVNLRTVCVLPVTAGVPVADFASRLVNSLSQLGTSIVSLNQRAVLNHLGRHAFTRMGKLKLSQYLADLEEKFDLVLFVADTNVQSPWTGTCITQSDCVLIVGLAESSPAVGEFERLLLTTKTTARKELVLLHNERLCPPGLTRKWLSNRVWINGGHHHIQMSFSITPGPTRSANRRFGSTIKKSVLTLQAEIQKYTGRKVRHTPLYSADTPFKSDFHRLARRLCGKSVGLVLGGGGARGIAHVGIIRALEEAGIPIDIVGGTSIGAFVGALYAWDAGIVPMYGRMKRFAGRMGSMWRFMLDLTYPS